MFWKYKVNKKLCGGKKLSRILLLYFYFFQSEGLQVSLTLKQNLHIKKKDFQINAER